MELDKPWHVLEVEETFLALLFLATTLPLLQLVLSTVSLGWTDWGTVLLVSSSIFVAVEIWKWLPRRFLT
jgi:hypothetical protein